MAARSGRRGDGVLSQDCRQVGDDGSAAALLAATLFGTDDVDSAVQQPSKVRQIGLLLRREIPPRPHLPHR
jgi:hypothetical protein